MDTAANALANSQRLLVLSGAGLSAESGIPTFREAQTGLWAEFSPQDLATPEAFAADPERVWAWYRWRRTLIARGGVNAGHRAIAALERHMAVVIATQNVDGLQTTAGSHDVSELHGNIWVDRCSSCSAESRQPVAEADDDAPLPHCEECGEAIPQARREAIKGVRLCIACQSERDKQRTAVSGYNRRGSKDSQLR